jgi:hypothetical protein
MAFFRFILILLLIYYGLRVLTRLVLPYLAKRWISKAQEKFNNQQGYSNPEEAKKREGEVKFKTNFKSQSNPTNDKVDLGEYIDYEEIKDDKK